MSFYLPICKALWACKSNVLLLFYSVKISFLVVRDLLWSSYDIMVRMQFCVRFTHWTGLQQWKWTRNVLSIMQGQAVSEANVPNMLKNKSKQSYVIMLHEIMWHGMSRADYDDGKVSEWTKAAYSKYSFTQSYQWHNILTVTWGTHEQIIMSRLN